MIVTMIMLMTMTMIIMKMTPMLVIMMRLRKKVVTAMQLLSSGKEWLKILNRTAQLPLHCENNVLVILIIPSLGSPPSTLFWMALRRNTWTCWREESLPNCSMKSGVHLPRSISHCLISWGKTYTFAHLLRLNLFANLPTPSKLVLSSIKCQIVPWSVVGRGFSSSGLPFSYSTWSPCRWPSTRGQTSSSPWWEGSRRAPGTSPRRTWAGLTYTGGT